MQTFLQRMMPFFLLGIIIVIFVFGLILFSYLLICGALVGFVLFIIAWAKEKFFPVKDLSVQNKRGRTFDQDK